MQCGELRRKKCTQVSTRRRRSSTKSRDSEGYLWINSCCISFASSSSVHALPSKETSPSSNSCFGSLSSCTCCDVMRVKSSCMVRSRGSANNRCRQQPTRYRLNVIVPPCWRLSHRTICLFLVGICIGLSAVMCGQSLTQTVASTTSDHCGTLHRSAASPDSSIPSDDDRERKLSSSKKSTSSVRSARKRSVSHLKSADVIPNAKKEAPLMFVGIMTAEPYLRSRAAAIASSWARSIPGKVVFFVGGDVKNIPSDLTSNGITSVIRLKGVNDATYPPQMKSFRMLKYISDHYADQFEWFVRADDDIYIRGDRLELLLRSLNSSRRLFMGQTGLGNREEYGQLSLGDMDNYCMGGTGMILSRKALSMVKGHFRDCVSSLFTGHEDVEIGRCIRRFAGVTCTWAYEMQSLFYNNKNVSSLHPGDLNRPEINHAITIHPLKQPRLLQQFHLHFRKSKHNDLQYRIIQLKRDIVIADRWLRVIGEPDGELESELGDIEGQYKDPSLLKWRPGSKKEILVWKYLSPGTLYCVNGVACPRHHSSTAQRYALTDIVNQILDLMNRHARQRGRILEFTEILYGYRRLDPLNGVDYILDMLLLYKRFKGKRLTVPVRRHAYLQQSLGSIETVEEVDYRSTLAPSIRGRNDKGHQSDTIHIIIPLSGRVSTFHRFLNQLESVCLQHGDADPSIVPSRSHRCGQLTLLVVYFEGSSKESHHASHDSINTGSSGVELVRAALRSLSSKHPSLQTDVLLLTGDFSRGKALMSGAEVKPPDALLFLSDVDVLFTADALYRIRQNTIRHRFIYFPIVFSEYDPNFASVHDARAASVIGEDNQSKDSHSLSFFWRSHFEYDDFRGYFRHFGFGVVALYQSDLVAVGGYTLHIKGWGLEDVNLFEKFLKSPLNYSIFRAPDPGLVHVYHPVYCDRSSLPHSQYKMCLGSQAASFASSRTLTDALFPFDKGALDRSIDSGSLANVMGHQNQNGHKSMRKR